jgi:hypothetical protein
MIRTKNNTDEPIIIDLAGPQGNAFALMGTAKNLGKHIGMKKEDLNLLIERMTSGDYENLLLEFDKAFGAFVILER